MKATVALPNIPQNQIRAVRTKIGLSLRELSRRAGLSATFVSDIERGNRRPSESVLSRISNILQTAPRIA